MARFKAWNASNSRAIAKFHNAEIGHFGHNTFIHELIRGSLTQMMDYHPSYPFAEGLTKALDWYLQNR